MSLATMDFTGPGKHDWLVFAGIGIYLIVTGAVAKTFLNESDVAGTSKERAAAKATPFRRIAVIAGGLISLALGIYLWLRK